MSAALTLVSRLDQACFFIFSIPWVPSYSGHSELKRTLCGQSDTPRITSFHLPILSSFPPGPLFRELFQLTYPFLCSALLWAPPFWAPGLSRLGSTYTLLLRHSGQPAYNRVQVTVPGVFSSACTELFRELVLVVNVGRLSSPG